MAAVGHLRVVGPSNEKRTVALPVRKPNAAYRSREHLTEREVERLVEAAKDNRAHTRTQPSPRSGHAASVLGQILFMRRSEREAAGGH